MEKISIYGHLALYGTLPFFRLDSRKLLLVWVNIQRGPVNYIQDLHYVKNNAIIVAGL